MIENLNLLGKEEEKEETIEFDEFINWDGNWEKSKSDSNNYKKVVELLTLSKTYRYFLCQNDPKDTMIYRVKK